MCYYFFRLHLWLFKNVATKHYQVSSDCFHDPPVKAPALVLASKTDPICSFKEMMEVVDGWREQNTKVNCFLNLALCFIKSKLKVLFLCLILFFFLSGNSKAVGRFSSCWPFQEAQTRICLRAE